MGGYVFLGLVTTSPSSDALSDPILAQSLSLWETTAIKILAYLPTSYSIWIGGTVTKKNFWHFFCFQQQLFLTLLLPTSFSSSVAPYDSLSLEIQSNVKRFVKYDSNHKTIYFAIHNLLDTFEIYCHLS